MSTAMLRRHADQRQVEPEVVEKPATVEQPETEKKTKKQKTE